MSKPLIRDIPQFRKLIEEASNFTSLKGMMPFLRPVLGLLGLSVRSMDEAFEDVGDLARQVGELVHLPDRFNSQFASRGWIVYEYMDATVVKSVVERAEAGDVDGAEEELVEYYDVENVRWGLRLMGAVDSFRPRMRLAELALIDYSAERFHACVPVVLSLLDGMVNAAHERRRGFFSEEANLTAWDSISAHERGLKELATIFQKGRYKTNLQPITIPFRNGILHGMDLAYDNKVVAAKCWAALFAARQWVVQAERGQLEAPPEKPPASWRNTLRKFGELAEDKSRVESWRPRQLAVGREIPPAGPPEAFSEGSPERKLSEYLHLWSKRNYGHMAKCLSPKHGPPQNKAPAQVRDEFKAKALLSWELISIEDAAAAVTKIESHLVYDEAGQRAERSFTFRLMNVDSSGMAAARGKPGTDWVIMTWIVC